MKTTTAKATAVRPVVEVITSERTLEGGGFDERHSWRSPLRGALRTSNLHPSLRNRHVPVPLLAPGEIVPLEDRALRAAGRRTGKPIC
ncbi:MAG: hypothetical protein A3E57_00515 [Candidatus Muproteobacteria bacterium RIFCSPHIGHO2_12_FULL_60_33]|uniref:Uncharacterized protein n=1 Tax=Candidatus Muproteobacteria bacterium RIFCSPLOWO2_01_FULL_60_18 TaxID=1817768 RepID=A0A1F6U608_9PROT|nr:MAG: hypothetical protein A2W42_00160 [Candidatus Muproteobacteria bacterium RIFCSPHIGHO2_01_60_12]OGI52791.1 MAG: hypothetical protein A3A87_02605 [Candidatus Muproteobacteria bacterium RIFCSPLOWO2_01_FULL_60_18]OGI54933.1 MAG: hypothetical protein A3D32_08505 [Candidatus Muproteobacteria bacterium RIFCSPHIGHO2_02_FULL_60_13]OGI55693.1 MAG: hypothetical protein A3E57_00515 [Candidatus Muproteobacteria bacterium RIFCSPHIGHO2_12_FULL_60_33]OGI58958.1 MAG: hypothetical protein A2809_03885 [Can